MLRSIRNTLVLLAALAAPAASHGASRAPDPAAAAPVFSALQRNGWYLPTSDGAADLYVTELGRGSPVVFLHGGPGDDFHYFIDALTPQMQHHRFILYDQRGSLLSPLEPGKETAASLDLLVDDLETLRQSLHLQKLALIGHSAGSVLALAYYQAHPDRVERLVLTGAFPPAANLKALIGQMRPRQKALQNRPEVAALLHREGLDGDPKALSPKQRSDKAHITGLASFDVIDLSKWRQVEGGGVFYNSAMDDRIGDSFPADLDFRQTILAHPVPIAVLQGDRDYVDPAGQSWRAFAAAHPGLPITVRVLPHATHYAWIDDPAAFAAGLAAVLGR